MKLVRINKIVEIGSGNSYAPSSLSLDDIEDAALVLGFSLVALNAYEADQWMVTIEGYAEDVEVSSA